MAEARSEEDEERLRETGGGRRSSEHSDRNKPDQRHSSQGALSSIRAVIKRTSGRTSSQSDHQRERRRPQITILSAEPLPTNSWFPGASGGFPPAPPPAPPTWAAGSATVQLPPPSYEQVIREKSREQNIQPPISSSSSPIPPPSSSPSSASARLSTSSIATQTDTTSRGPQSSAARPVRRPPKPPRPSPPVKNRDSLHEQCGVQTDFDDFIDDVTSTTPTPTDLTLIDSAPTFPASSPMDELIKSDPRPRPRPRSRIIQPETTNQPMTREVKVQTLVRLKDDTAENVFAGFDDTPSNISSKYLDDLMEVFSPDEAPQSQMIDGEENMKTSENRPQPRPRTLKSKTQITAKPSVFELFDGGDPEVQQNPFRSPPVPAPRPLLNKPAQVLENIPPGQQGAALVASSSEIRNSDDLLLLNKHQSPAKENTPPGQQGASLTVSLSERRNSDDLLLLNKRQSQAQVLENTPPGQQGAALTVSLSERRNSDDLLLLNKHQSQAQVLENTPPGQQGAALMPSFSERRNSDDLLFLNKHQSLAQDSRPENTPPGQQRAAPISSSSERRNGDEKAANAPAKTPTNRNAGKRPTVPKHSRPPPPVLRKSVSTSQVTVDVSSTPEASVPPLPPRPSGNRLLPLRPPPVKLNRPAGSSSSVLTNQLPESRVPKRGPPLPPRPRPGHPLYKRYSRTEPNENLEVQNPDKQQEQPSEETTLHEEEQFLIVLDEADVPETTANTLHDLQHSEVKGQDEAVSEVHLEDATSEKQIQQSTQNRLVVARFAFEGEEAELSFSEGDVITLIEYVNEEWGRGSLNGRIGIFPLSFIQAAEDTEVLTGKPALESPATPAGVSSKGRALYDFTAECEDELCLKAGDIVCDLEEMDADWFQGEFGGKRGIVPKNFIKLLQES